MMEADRRSSTQMTLGLILLSLVVAAFGAMIVVGGRQREAELERLPKLSCAALAEANGPARFEGRLRTDAPLTAPISGEPCAYYSLTAFKVTHNALDERSSVLQNKGFVRERYIHDARWAPVWLEDETGRVPLRGEGAEVEGARGPSVPLHGLVLGALESEEKSALRRKLGLPDGHFDVHESHIADGAQVFASGNAEDGALDCNGKSVVVGGEKEALERSGSSALGWVLILAGVIAAGSAGVVGSGLFDEAPTFGATGSVSPLSAPRPVASQRP